MVIVKYGYFSHIFMCSIYFAKNLSLIEGDILNDYDLDTALIECQYAIHIASLTDQNRLNYSDYEVVNVFGAKKVITACVRNNINKLTPVLAIQVKVKFQQLTPINRVLKNML